MAHVNAGATPHAQFSFHRNQALELPTSDICALETTRLYQRAINGLTEALNLLRNNPKSGIELQHALGRSMRGVTALKRLAALGGSSEPAQHLGRGAPPQPEPKVDETPAVHTNMLTKKRRRRRHFDACYKRQVVQLIRKQHLTISQVSKELNLTYSAVRRWLLEFDVQETHGPMSPSDSDNSGTGTPAAHQLSDAEQRIRQLEERLQQLQSDHELLKKASASFAREIHGLCAASGQ